MDKNLKLINDTLVEAWDKLLELEGATELTLKLAGAHYLLSNMNGVDSVDKIQEKLVYYQKNDEYYGKVGEKTNYKNYQIGDLVQIKGANGNIYSLVVKTKNKYTVFGWGTVSLEELESNHKLILLKKYNVLDSIDFKSLKYQLSFV